MEKKAAQSEEAKRKMCEEPTAPRERLSEQACAALAEKRARLFLAARMAEAEEVMGSL